MRRIAFAVAVLFLASCPAEDEGLQPPFTGSGLGPDEIPLIVDQRCPGDPACAEPGDGRLYACTAKRDISPLVEPFVDVNQNQVYDRGEPFTDLDGDGRFDRVWIAGYGSGRMAFGVHDPTWIRCWGVRQNQTTVVNCSVDSVGLFQGEAQQIRADLDPALGVDLFMLSSTHLHETQDTTGLWGPDDTTSGYDPDYMRRIRRLTVEAVSECVRSLEPAKLSLASIQVADPSGDLTPYVWDSRDPVVIDSRLHLLQLDGADDGKPIVTVVNWSSHPESVGSDNHYITSDFVHYLRESVEAGTGSDVVFVNGSVGGQIGPGRVQPIGDDGNPLPRERSFRFAQAWGEGVARFALKAFGARKEAPSPRLAFWHTSFNAHVENFRYHAAYLLNLLERPMFGYDPAKPLLRTDEFDNAPLVSTEVAYLRLGPAAIITCPGELLPENFLGGYDGSERGTYEFVDATQANAPDVTQAPRAPYLIDLMGGEREHRMVFGLTLDFLGYIVPRYNFVLDPLAPYVAEAEGDHYEETNSIGSRAEPELVGTMRQIAMTAEATPPSR